jgi:hypothetical protein
MLARETGDGRDGLHRTGRTEALVFDLAAEVQQLWNALAIHYEMALNATAAWALVLLNEPGEKVGKRPPDLGVGLKRPKHKFPAGNRYSKEEKELWIKLKSIYPGGYAGVLTAGLVELYWKEPVDLRQGNLKKPRWDPEEDEGDDGVPV